MPADLMAGVFRRYEAQKERQGRIDFEDLLELAIRLYDEDAAARRDLSRPLPRLHGRRVPGREPPPAVAARALARRSRRPRRGRRRLPVDLLLHRGDAGVPVEGPGQGLPPRGELPLDARDPRAREPARAEARRRREGAPRDPPGRRAAGAAGLRGRRGGDRRDRRATSGPTAGKASPTRRSRCSTGSTLAQRTSRRRWPRRAFPIRCAAARSWPGRRRAG